MRIALVALGLLLVSAVAWADIVELKTGQRVEGTLKQVTADSVAIESGGQTTTLEREKVRAIYFETTSTPAAPTSPAREAIHALKGAQAATRSRESFKDYSAQLAGAKAAVEKYLQGPEGGDPAVKEAVGAALHYHVLASSALKPGVTDAEFTTVGSDPALDQCRQFKEVLATVQKVNPRAFTTGNQERTRGFIVSAFGINAVWACAADKIAEAERLLDKKP